MTGRPLFQQSLDDLEAMIDRNRENDAELALVEQELRIRTTKRARDLLAKLQKLRRETDAPREKHSAALKYARVHAEAEAQASPTMLGWKHRARWFVAGPTDENRADSVYGTIRRICMEAGSDGISAAALTTELRKRQIGNPRSVYCDGLPPIGWAEGWIDTAVTKQIVMSIERTTAERPITPSRPAVLASPPASPALPTSPTPIAREPQPMNDARRWTEEAIASLRTKLIDLSKRSPLISFKHSGRSASLLRFVDERPDLLFESIQKGAVGFEPLPGEDETPKDERTATFQIAYERAELTDPDYLSAIAGLGDDERDAKKWQEAERKLRATVRDQLSLPPLDYGKALDVVAIAKAHGFDPSYDLKASDDEDVAAHHADDKLRVLLTAKDLDKRLKAIGEKSGTHKRETGLHTLFLVFGFVQWHEDEAASAALHAPLLLLDVDLRRTVQNGRYVSTLTAGPEGLQVNVALGEKMRQHWGLELPALREDESPESYFIRVEAVLAKGQRLSLRRFATLAVLPFPRMVLWKDLDPAAWPEAAFSDHRLLPGLLGAAQVSGEATAGDTIDIDAPEWATTAPALIRPADASQHSALIDMAAGHDLAIEGPPGTGKSETITNMIATALGAGKRVLFVAEKQAALRVVADRLRASGFGALLLELHGDNANRADVYAGLNQRLDTKVSVDAGLLNSQRLQLNQQRSLLRRYLSLINQPLGSLDRTTFWLVWHEIKLRAELKQSVVEAVAALWQPADARAINRATLADHRDRLDTFGTALQALDADRGGDGPRTRWTAAGRLDPFDQSAHLKEAETAAQAAELVDRAVQALNQLAVIDLPDARGPIDQAAGQFGQLAPFDPVSEEIARAALRHPEAARALLRQQARWRQLAAKLASDVSAPANVDDAAVAELAAALDDAAPVPGTIAAVHALQGRVTELVTATERGAADLQLLAERLKIAPGMTIAVALEAFSIIGALDGEPTLVTSLYRAELLDPLADAVLTAERQVALDWQRDRDEAVGRTSTDAMEADTEELIGLAETLRDSGMVARLFGSAYRKAKRRVGQLIVDPSDRLETADLLDQVARLQGKARTFQGRSAAASWFPAMLWRGADSHWDAITKARTVLLEARDRLARLNAEGMLDQWLAMPPNGRASIAPAIARLAAITREATEVDLGEVPLLELADTVGEERRAIDRLVRALNAVGGRTDAVIFRDGASLAERLAGMHAAAREFEILRGSQAFTWVGAVDDDLEPLARTLTHADALRSIDGPISIAILLEEAEEPTALLDQLIAAGIVWTEAIAGWTIARDRLHDSASLAPERLGTDWSEIAAVLAAMAADQSGARLAADLQKYGQALNEVGLSAFAAMAIDGTAPASQLADVYELLLIRDLLRGYLGGDGAELGRIGGLTLDRARSSFTQIDKELHALEARAIVAERLGDKAEWGNDVGRVADYTELALINHELSLKRPRTPLRDVIHRAGTAMQTLKPVWMMSPTSAAQYIRPGALAFDLLVIDEASQMRPEYAISAVLRGAQFVVVGDANQLPPSDHFQSAGDDGADGDGVGVSPDTESILDLANQRFRRKRRLKWHYRSQHESLIQFSNRQFYERDLVVFPSPMGNEDDLLGVKCHYVADALYEASINQREAEAVIEEAFRLMRAYPQHSIGVAAMNAKQTELIQNEFDRLILEQPEIRRYVNEYAGGVDEFFIKNLENVQGDERDIILISTVYGPGKDGRVLQNFGLMNREVGWRRLNVLVTRAKLSTRLFTSLRPDDIKVTATSSRGVRTLRDYLTYAHQGASYEDASGGEPDSDFEVFVADALRDAGYQVIHQVGVEGFRIDLGIRHPDYPIGFIAGVECDGASFHQSLTVRDRDRIRQSVLENMGWKIYRIWSTDWFGDPARELARLLHFLDQSRAAFADSYAHRPAPAPSSATPAAAIVEETTQLVELEPVTVPVSPPSDEIASPQGRAMRPLDDISWYEVVKGQAYEVWLDDRLAGEVEVLARAMAAPRLYGGQAIVSKSEIEGRIAATGEHFRMNDIHAVVREVARRARAIQHDPEDYPPET